MCLLGASPAAWAEGSDDAYIGIYSLIKQGDLFVDRGQNSLAASRYIEAQTALKQFQSVYPLWNTNVVSFRLNYLAGRIAQLSSGKAAVRPAEPPVAVTPAAVKPPPVTPPPTNTTAATPPITNAPPAAAPVTNMPEQKIAIAPPPPVTNAVPQALPSDAAERIAALQDQVARLESDKSLLESKLKEALAARPAASDPRELERAQERIRSLEKENDLLKISLAAAKTNTVQANLALLEQTRKELAEANRKVNELTDANLALSTERDALKARVASLAAAGQDAASVAALRQENNILKKELADLKTKAASNTASDEVTRKLMETQTQLAAVQSDKEILRVEKLALEDRIRELSMKTNAATVVSAPIVDSETTVKIKALELQRDELQKSLDAATKEIYGRKKGKETAARIDEMTRQLTGLRARIDTLEAKQVPYSPEELSLLSKPDMKLSAVVRSEPKPARPPSAKVAALMAEGEKFYSSQQLPEAEAKYQEALKLDEKNINALLNLASVQGDEKKMDLAEKNFQTALALDPKNERALFTLGWMRYQQRKLDEALDLFSRAAEVNPQNPAIQNYIGVTLSEKGLRGPAESAFRKAIQLDPTFGEAHANLAVVYITQQPPLTELARWHYQKAIAAGYRPNPGLQKILYPDGGISAR